MTGRHYLLRVLGLSAIPRVLTFGLTLLSFPLMVRTLGAREYGIFVFLSAITLVLEAGVDFGVSAAAGKNLAEARERRPNRLQSEILRWARLQATAALTGLVPLLGITYFVASRTSTIELPSGLIVVFVFATWVNIGLNFVRASLTSLLAFRSLAVLDTCESLLRSSGYVVVAYAAPSASGLAAAALVTAVGASSVGATLLWRAWRKVNGLGGDRTRLASSVPLSLAYMLNESINFLWLRLAARAFQSVPLIIFGRLFGSEVVGAIGAFSKAAEIVNLPCAVVGNALAVRANEVLAKGAEAVQALWDAASRFLAASVLLAASMYLGADILARVLLKGGPSAAHYFRLLSLTVTTTAISSLIAPMSDYVGALKARNVLLTICALVEIPLIWICGTTFGASGAVGVYVIVQVLMTMGYVYIALRVLNPTSSYRIRAELRYLLGITILAVVGAAGLSVLPWFLRPSMLRWYGSSMVPIALLWSTVFTGLLLDARARNYFLSMRFFDFESIEPTTRRAHSNHSSLR